MAFFGPTKSELADRIQQLERTVADLRVDVAKVDLVALERVHGQVLNAIRSLRRLQEPQEPRGDVSPVDDPTQLSLRPKWAREAK